MIARLPLPVSAENPTQPNLSAGALREYELLCLEQKAWDMLCLNLDEVGTPLVQLAADGELVINDPLLAQWDAQARANAQVEVLDEMGDL